MERHLRQEEHRATQAGPLPKRQRTEDAWAVRQLNTTPELMQFVADGTESTTPIAITGQEEADLFTNLLEPLDESLQATIYEMILSSND